MLKYVPVMARPLVLGRTDHPTIWTPVYADITDPKITDWLWEQHESEEQKSRFLRYHRNKKYFNMEEQDRRFVKKQKRRHDQASGLQEYKEYKLMTSVSMPVFDRRENAVRFLFIHYFVEQCPKLTDRKATMRLVCRQLKGLIKIPLRGSSLDETLTVLFSNHYQISLIFFFLLSALSYAFTFFATNSHSF